MILSRKQRAQIKTRIVNNKPQVLLLLVTFLALCLVINRANNADNDDSSPVASSKMRFRISNIDDKCKNLPTIKPSGVFFLDNKVKNVLSSDGISPEFKIGSYFGEKARYHMADDIAHFALIEKLLKKKNGGLTFDIGANQGFFTYYLAALGMNVHSFEISPENFVALMHGRHFNTKSIADRVNLYPLGLDDKISRFSLSGANYAGFLKDSEEGPILGVTFDCFAHHTKLNLSKVSFVKLDVEGFEIAVLMGAANSLFRRKGQIGGMLMEVGPKRWKRAKINFDTGFKEMEKLASKFKKSHVLFRVGGGFVKSCPKSLAERLSDDKPEPIERRALMYKVKPNELKGLLEEMEKHDYDCNFWYTN